MNIQKIPIGSINPAKYNPRIDLKPTDAEYIKLKNSIQSFGYVEPIIVNKNNNVIIGGHQRYKVLVDLGYTDVDVVYVDLDDTKEKALNIALNKISGDWDADKLEDLLRDIQLDNSFDISLTGFDTDEINNILGTVDEVSETSNSEEELDEILTEQKRTQGALKERYGIPPFTALNLSILYTRDSDWTKNNQFWKDKIGDDSLARSNATSMLRDVEQFNKKYNKNTKGVSILDPTLCEIVNRWFLPKTKGNKTFDTFAGGLSFGFVTTAMENYYTGIELRQEQVDYNYNRIKQFGYDSFCEYICDDALNVDKYIEDNSMDLYFDCPPYYNLDVYSDKENDASNQETYEDFLKIMSEAYYKAIKKLKRNRFAVVVVGDVRANNHNGKDTDINKSYYLGFPDDVKKIFKSNGMNLYNELILVNNIVNGAMFAASRMQYRKVTKVHQNVLVFYKGNIADIKNEFYNIDNCYKEINDLPIFKNNNTEEKLDESENV